MRRATLVLAVSLGLCGCVVFNESSPAAVSSDLDTPAPPKDAGGGDEGVDVCPSGCDDGDPCTLDACDAELGCLHSPRQAPCDDGDPCTLADQCVDGICTPGPPDPCHDDQPCTEDSCSPGTGCVHTPVDALCHDLNPCTVDRCVPTAGGCTSTMALGAACPASCLTGVGRVTLPGRWAPRALARDGSVALVITQATVDRYALTAGQDPAPLASLPFDGGRSVAIAGGKAWISNAFGVHRLSVEGPGIVVEASGPVPFGGSTVRDYEHIPVALTGDHVLSAARGQLFLVHNDTLDLVETVQMPGETQTRDLVLVDKMAYVLGATAVQMVDVSDVDAPVLDAAWPSSAAGAFDVAHGHIWFLTNSSLTLKNLDDVGAKLVPGPELPSSTAVRVSGQQAYTIGFGGLNVLTVTLPAEAGDEIQLELAGQVTLDQPAALAVGPTAALVGVDVFGQGAVYQIDASDPSDPAIAGQHQDFGRSEGVAVGSEWVFVADGLGGVRRLDRSQPVTLGALETYVTPASALGVHAVKGGALVASGGLVRQLALDETGARTLPASAIDAGGEAADFATRGDHVFVAAGSTVAVLTTDPLVRIGQLHDPSRKATSIAIVAGSSTLVVGDRDVTFGAGGIRTVDISDPTSPVMLGAVGTTQIDAVGERDGLVVAGGLGLTTVDVTDPKSPETLGQAETAHTVVDVLLAGTVAVACGPMGLWLVDVSDPSTPTTLAVLPLLDEATGLATDGERLFISGGRTQLELFEASCP